MVTTQGGAGCVEGSVLNTEIRVTPSMFASLGMTLAVFYVPEKV